MDHDITLKSLQEKLLEHERFDRLEKRVDRDRLDRHETRIETLEQRAG